MEIHTRESLICKVRDLLMAHDAKQEQYRKNGMLGDDVGCITREACEMMSLLPQMHSLGISFDDCK